MSDNLALLGRQIRHARIRSGLSLRGLARQIGLSPTYLSRCECASEPMSPPSEETLRKIAESIDLPLSDLMHLAGRVPHDVEAIIIGDSTMVDAIRAARDNGISGSDIVRLIRNVADGNAPIQVRDEPAPMTLDDRIAKRLEDGPQKLGELATYCAEAPREVAKALRRLKYSGKAWCYVVWWHSRTNCPCERCSFTPSRGRRG